MRKTLKYFLIFSIITILCAFVYLFSIEGKYNIHRTVIVNAPIEKVFDYVNDYRNWEKWGPWNDYDPNLEYQYPDKTSGIGASYSWLGKDGSGSLKTIHEVKNQSILQKLTFDKNNQSDVYWNFEKIDSLKTKTTWGMKGELPIYMRFSVGTIQDKLGKLFDKGLVSLNQHIENTHIQNDTSQ